MSHWGAQWQRRSSSLRSGRPSNDGHRGTLGGGSRIPLPRGFSAAVNQGVVSSGLGRSKSTYQADTPLADSKTTPQHPTPMLFHGFSSKKKGGFQNYQKNLQDKDFLKDAHRRVLNYFQTHKPEVLTDGDIRPMSIKMFCSMLNHLFEAMGLSIMDDPVVFTPTNYAAELPNWLKHDLEYPGQIQQRGWLTTVSAPHYFPNVLGLLFFLVIRAEGDELFTVEDELLKIAEQDEQKMFNFRYFQSVIATFNQEEEVLSDACKAMAKESAHLKGCSDEFIHQLQHEKRVLEEQLNDSKMAEKEQALTELELMLASAQAREKKGLEEIQSINDQIDCIKVEISKKQMKCSSLVKETKQTTKDIELLKEKIANQPLSVPEFLECKQKCDNISKEISYYEKEIDENVKVLSRHEHDITSKRDKILQCASTFNRQVIQLEQKVPDLHGLRARTDPESADVLVDIEKMESTLRELKEKYASEYRELKVKESEKLERIEALKEKIREVIQCNQSLEAEIAAKKDEIKKFTVTAEESVSVIEAEIAELEKQLTMFSNKEEAKGKLLDEVKSKEKQLALHKAAEAHYHEICDKKWQEIKNNVDYFEREIRAMHEKLENNQREIDVEVEKLAAEMEKAMKNPWDLS